MSSVQTTIGWFLRCRPLRRRPCHLRLPQPGEQHEAPPHIRCPKMPTRHPRRRLLLVVASRLRVAQWRGSRRVRLHRRRNQRIQPISKSVPARPAMRKSSRSPSIQRCISYRDLLHIFFVLARSHDAQPSGADVGTNIVPRSSITRPSRKSRGRIDRGAAKRQSLGSPHRHAIAPLETFYKAEDYHQGYFRANPRQPLPGYSQPKSRSCVRTIWRS